MSERPVDPAAIGQVVATYPVRLAILFGSHAAGTPAVESDVDVAVAFDPGLSSAERLTERIDLVVALSEELGRNPIDVADFDTIKPAVGADALERGIVCYEEGDAYDHYRDAFKRVRSRTEMSREEQLARFDEILDRLEELV